MLSATQQKKLKDLRYELQNVEKEVKRLINLKSSLVKSIRNLDGMANASGYASWKVKKSDSFSGGGIAIGNLRLDSKSTPPNYCQEFKDKMKNFCRQDSDSDSTEDYSSMTPREVYNLQMKNIKC